VPRQLPMATYIGVVGGTYRLCDPAGKYYFGPIASIEVEDQMLTIGLKWLAEEQIGKLVYGCGQSFWKVDLTDSNAQECANGRIQLVCFRNKSTVFLWPRGQGRQLDSKDVIGYNEPHLYLVQPGS